MSDAPVTVEFDLAALERRLLANFKRGQIALDIQVLKDSNYFCPEDEGTLQSSGITNSEPGTGVLVWATPYARRQYYEAPNKSLDKNPNARMKWFEEAKAIHLGDWLMLAMKETGNA